MTIAFISSQANVNAQLAIDSLVNRDHFNEHLSDQGIFHPLVPKGGGVRWDPTIYRFKMAVKLPIFISRHCDFGKNWKNHFPKRIIQ